MPWGEWVDLDLEYWDSGEVVGSLTWFYEDNDDSFPRAGIDVSDIFADKFQDALDVPVYDGFSGPSNPYATWGYAAASFTNNGPGGGPNTTSDFEIRGTEIAFAASASGDLTDWQSQDLFPYPFPDEATNQEFESQYGTYLGEATFHITYETYLFESDFSPSETAIVTVHLKQADSTDMEDYDVVYSPSGTSLWSTTPDPITAGATVTGGSPEIDVSSFADPVTGLFAIKTAADLVSLTVPTWEEQWTDHGGTTVPRQSSTTWLGFTPRFRCKAPRVRYFYPEEPPEPEIPPVTVVRQYPRDDQYGLGSAPRLHPPPSRGRVVGGLQ